MSEIITPAEFNLEEWALDANLPEESADVFKRADVVGELSALKRQIAAHREAFDGEKSAGEETGLAILERKYAELLQTFSDSLLTVYVRGLTSDELQVIREAHDEGTKTWEPRRRNVEFGFDLLAAAITAVRPYGGERTTVSWDKHQVKKLEKAIGGAQMQLILAAREVAQNQVPAVDADFLLKPSGSEIGEA
jgi:hypothetical protein